MKPRPSYEQTLARKLERPGIQGTRYGMAFLQADGAEMQRQVSLAMGNPGTEDFLLPMPYAQPLRPPAVTAAAWPGAPRKKRSKQDRFLFLLRSTMKVPIDRPLNSPRANWPNSALGLFLQGTGCREP